MTSTTSSRLAVATLILVVVGSAWFAVDWTGLRGDPVIVGAAASQRAAAAPDARPAAVPSVPVPEQEATSGFKKAQEVFGMLRSGVSRESCTAAWEGLTSLLMTEPERSALGLWTMDRVASCVRVMGTAEEQSSLLASLLAKKPGSFRLLLELGRTEMARSDYVQAMRYFEQANAVEVDSYGLTQLANSKLLAALEVQYTTGNNDERLALLRDAEVALAKADSIAGASLDAWTLQKMAKVKLGLGKPTEAMEWVERAVLAMKGGGSSEIEQISIAALYFNIGEIYYKAGQRGTGIAYMDQAIGLAPAGDVEDLTESKSAVLEGRR